MFTSDSIRNLEFEQVGRNGYRADEVDAFLDEIAAQLDAVQREKAELIAKLQVLAEKIEEYREDEDSIKTALLNAQRMGDRVMRESSEKAAAMVEEATIKSRELLEKAREEAALVESKARQRGEGIIALAQSKADEMASSIEEKYKKQYNFYCKFKEEAENFKEQLLGEYQSQMSTLQAMKVEMEHHSRYEQAVPQDIPAVEPAPTPVSVPVADEESAKRPTKGFTVHTED